ncbi:MarR family transcriptional regulator [Microbulbifer sp.]|uniref:MarR family winged helix-turn-helix transcriptional regulator n=1 Tax=Microbulbifer sp. TaxID=1908541 RepID=UPI00258EC88C|nr:MarR family transcriptional regulator [Microbulbifer sp.]
MTVEKDTREIKDREGTDHIDAMRPDDLRLEKFLPYRLSVLSNRVSNAIAQAYGARFDLTIPAWRVMAILGRFPNLSAADLVEQTAMDKVAISRAVSILIKNDYITRSEDPADRRRQVLNLSEIGRDVYDRIVPLAQQYENDLMASLSDDERSQLDSIIEKLMSRAQDWANRGLID